MHEPFLGIPCIIAQQIKKQKKTSKYKVINWIYKKIYGYEYESVLPEGTDMLYFNGSIIFRNEETFEWAKRLIIEKEQTYE